MTFQKQKEIIDIIYAAKLDNGVIINVFGNYAVGNDGKIYYHIGREKDGILKTIGWSCDIDKAVILD